MNITLPFTCNQFWYGVLIASVLCNLVILSPDQPEKYGTVGDTKWKNIHILALYIVAFMTDFILIIFSITLLSKRVKIRCKCE